MSGRHVLLVARQVAHTGGQETIRELADAVAAALRHRDDPSPVGACFLDGETPSLVAALDQAVPTGTGCRAGRTSSPVACRRSRSPHRSRSSPSW